MLLGQVPRQWRASRRLRECIFKGSPQRRTGRNKDLQERQCLASAQEVLRWLMAHPSPQSPRSLNTRFRNSLQECDSWRLRRVAKLLCSWLQPYRQGNHKLEALYLGSRSCCARCSHFLVDVALRHLKAQGVAERKPHPGLCSRCGMGCAALVHVCP